MFCVGLPSVCFKLIIISQFFSASSKSKLDKMKPQFSILNQHVLDRKDYIVCIFTMQVHSVVFVQTVWKAAL